MASGPKSKKAAPRKRARKKVARGVKRVTKAKTTRDPESAELSSVVLGTQPGIKNVADLKDRLTAAYGADSPVVIDAGEVESVDTATLQLLAAFANSLREKSGSVKWKKPSRVFREMADLADLSECLGMSDESVDEKADSLCPVF